MAWSIRPPQSPNPLPDRRFETSDLVDGVIADLENRSADAVVHAAERLLGGNWSVFGLERTDMVPAPDWFACASTGLRAPAAEPAFRIQHRDASTVGDNKFVWELSRHQHLTVLSAAFALTKNTAFAKLVAGHLESWIKDNPPRIGMQWTSGVELGLRLVSWVWCRRLLSGWEEVADHFEANPMFLESLWHHQLQLAQLASEHSSANNHRIAEDVGLLTSSLAFPWFETSSAWAAQAEESLAAQLVLQTFESGVNKELATEYHRFVLELALVALAESKIQGQPLAPAVETTARKMLKAVALLIDDCGRPMRQGDSDDAFGLLLDPPELDGWDLVVSLGGHNDAPRGLRSALFCAILKDLPSTDGEEHRSEAMTTVSDAGMTLLRGSAPCAERMIVRFDHGAHGYLKTAAHAHADALSIEVRVGTTELLADPGTFTYRNDSEFREYFRSTIAHNCVQLFDSDQSKQLGPFLWGDTASVIDPRSRWSSDGQRIEVSAGHDGYAHKGAIHHRQLDFNPTTQSLTVRDTIELQVEAEVPVAVAFHFGPTVQVRPGPEWSIATLSWTDDSEPRWAEMSLDPSLSWSIAKGREKTPLGWYSSRLANKVPTAALIGRTTVRGSTSIETDLRIVRK